MNSVFKINYETGFMEVIEPDYKEVNERKIHEVYSDRLVHWDYNKYNELCIKHFGNRGQYWNNREPEKIEAFLSEYFDKEVDFIRKKQFENVSNGYPYWLLTFCYKEEV